jgi:hypothetical protein
LTAFEITRGSAADIPSLEPLWVIVYHAHTASMPELGPYDTWHRSAETSTRVCTNVVASDRRGSLSRSAGRAGAGRGAV